MRWKLGHSGKPWAFRENECANGTTGVKNRAFVETQCAEGTLSKSGHFGEKIGLLGKISVQKGHFGENWAVRLLTGLIQKTSVPKDLKWKLGLLGKTGLSGKMTLHRGLLGVKQGFCKKSVCLMDIEEIWTFWEENGTLGKKECMKGTLW